MAIDDFRLTRAKPRARHGGNRQSSIVNRQSHAHGVVLLEVVVAMSLFFAAAVVILLGLHSSLQAAKTLKFEARAADLAVTLMSEIEIGLVPPEDAGPEGYEDERLEDWTWEIVTEDVEPNIELDEPLPLTRVTVTIAHERTGWSYTLHRMFSSEPTTAGNSSESDSGTDVEIPDTSDIEIPSTDVSGYGGGR